MLELPSSELLHQQLQALGISDTSRVIVYSDSRDVPTTTRVIFTLDAAGLGSRTSLLDGGLQAWAKSGGTLTKAVAAIERGKLAPLTMQSHVVDADFVQQHLKMPGYRIIDARAPVFYDGVRAGMGSGAKGHLPGAASIPFTSVTTTELMLKPADELASLFQSAGVAAGDHVIAYCHIGQQGTAVVFAARTLGIDVALYDGSFEDWSQRGLPVEMPAKRTP
jgi:thiosulfate/3-mercaptopyruvate sulfurtransferase